MVGVRRRPTLPHCFRCRTIGAGGLSFRVRNVAGRFPSAITAVTLSTCQNNLSDLSTSPICRSAGLIFRSARSARPGVRSGWGLFAGCDVHGGRGQNSFLVVCGERPVCERCVCCVVLKSSAYQYQSAEPITRLTHLACLPGVLAGGLTPTPVKGLGGSPGLEAGFPLRCFQRLSLPNVANQPCPWRDNWHTRGSSVPVLSY